MKRLSRKQFDAEFLFCRAVGSYGEGQLHSYMNKTEAGVSHGSNDSKYKIMSKLCQNYVTLIV